MNALANHVYGRGAPNARSQVQLMIKVRTNIFTIACGPAAVKCANRAIYNRH